nr:unnamed protein product [uncultured bacterium]
MANPPGYNIPVVSVRGLVPRIFVKQVALLDLRPLYSKSARLVNGRAGFFMPLAMVYADIFSLL